MFGPRALPFHCFRRLPFAARSFSTASADDTVGFIGIGIMGRGMARRLVDSGKKVVVWNRSTEKSLELQSLGGSVTIASSPREVVERSAVTYSMLTTPEVSREVFFSPNDGTIHGISPGKTLVECSTVDEQTMIDLENAVNEKQGKFLEAPVSGSKGPAETGQLVFLCGGNKEVFDSLAETDLKCMGKSAHFLGEVGKGTRMKLVVNMTMGIMMAGLAEAVRLSQALGLEENSLADVLSQAAVANPMFALKLPGMWAGGPFPAHFPLKHAQKDMRLALELDPNLSVATAVDQIFLQSLEQGLGEQDFSAVILETAKKPAN